MKQLIIAILLPIFFYACSNSQEPAYYLKTGCYPLSETSTDYKRACYNSNRSFDINPKAIIDVKQFKEVWMSTSTGKFLINIVLTDIGTNMFSEATEKCNGKYLAFVVDDELIMVPKITGKIIDGSVMIDGNFTEQEMMECYKKIKASMDNLKTSSN